MNSFSQALLIVAMGGVASLTHWKVSPQTLPPVVACDPAAILPGEICLATVLAEWPPETMLWIDARSEAEWKADGLPGSIHLTTMGKENFEDLLAAAGPQLMEGKKVVVYCGSTSCGLSKEVVSLLERYEMVPNLIPEAKALHGGYDALKAAGMINVPGSSPKP